MGERYNFGPGPSQPALQHAHVTNTNNSSWPYFVAGEGIEHRVIQTDICRYLGSDARVKRGRFEGTDGYFYAAYRTFTHPMISSLREDSSKWWEERKYSHSDDYHKSNTLRDSRARSLSEVAQPPQYHDPPQPAIPTHVPMVETRYQYTHDGNRFYDNHQQQYLPPPGPQPGVPGGASRHSDVPQGYHLSTSDQGPDVPRYDPSASRNEESARIYYPPGNDQNQVITTELPGNPSSNLAQWPPQPAPLPDPRLENRHERRSRQPYPEEPYRGRGRYEGV